MSEHLENAIRIAVVAHQGQVRKDERLPYISHLIAVALILAQHGFSDEVIAAGLTHDVLEDTEYPAEDLRSGIGEGAYAIVAAVTNDDALPWDLSHTRVYLAASPNNQSIEHPELRKYHLANRDRQEARAGATFEATQAVAVNFSGGYSAATYPDSRLGLSKYNTLLLDADISYAPASGVTASAFYTFERMLSRQNGYILGNGNLTNPQQYWQAGNRDTTHTIGLRADWRPVSGKYKAGVSYDLSLGGMRTDVESNPFVIYTVTAPLPDTREITHNFGLKAEYAVRVDTTVRIGYNFQRHVSRDWQYDLSIAPVAQVLGSGITPPRYTAHVVSLTTRFDF